MYRLARLVDRKGREPRSPVLGHHLGSIHPRPRFVWSRLNDSGARDRTPIFGRKNQSLDPTQLRPEIGIAQRSASKANRDGPSKSRASKRGANGEAINGLYCVSRKPSL